MHTNMPTKMLITNLQILFEIKSSKITLVNSDRKIRMMDLELGLTEMHTERRLLWWACFSSWPRMLTILHTGSMMLIKLST